MSSYHYSTHWWVLQKNGRWWWSSSWIIFHISILYIYLIYHIYTVKDIILCLSGWLLDKCPTANRWVRSTGFCFSIADNDCSDDEKLNKIQCSRLTFHKVRNIDSLTHWIRYLEMLIFDRGEPTLFKWIFGRCQSRGQVRTANPRTERCL